MSSLQNLSEHVAIRASVSPLRTGNPLFSPGCHLPHVPSPQTEGIRPTGQLQVQAVALISVLLTPPCPSSYKEELVPRLVPSPTGLFSDFEVPGPSVPRPLPDKQGGGVRHTFSSFPVFARFKRLKCHSPGSPVDCGPSADTGARRMSARGLQPVDISRPAVGVGALLGGKTHLARLWPGRGGQELTARRGERSLSGKPDARACRLPGDRHCHRANA